MLLNLRVVESEGCRYEVVESKVVESKFVEFMLHSRRGSSLQSVHYALHLHLQMPLNLNMYTSY